MFPAISGGASTLGTAINEAAFADTGARHIKLANNRVILVNI
jgi:hypothetical protein